MFFNIAKNITLVVLNNHKMSKILLSTIYITLLYSFVYTDVYKETDKEKINQLIDKWHNDVANYDLEAYFNFMDSSFVFLGTAPGEYWTKNEFYVFCKPYFDKKSTWNFTPKKRHVYINGNTAWFDENLDTWMEGCRGTGVLNLKGGNWKLLHYNLTVLIENEKMKKFIKLRKR